MHLPESGHEIPAPRVDARRPRRDGDAARRPDGGDAAVRDDHGVVGKHTLAVHGHDVGAREGERSGRGPAACASSPAGSKAAHSAAVDNVAARENASRRNRRRGPATRARSVAVSRMEGRMEGERGVRGGTALGR
jgi:hypothetical protein